MGGHKITAAVSWCESNYCCGWSDAGLGAVIVTGKTLEGVKKDFEESLRLHFSGCVEAGDEVPSWMVRGEYEIEFSLDASAPLNI